jgi:basic amino acid/polyamine antiporter, APA family
MMTESRKEEQLNPEPVDQQKATAPGSLLRVLGVGFGIAVTVGNSIGAGIMRTPGENAARLRNGTLILSAWMIGAFYSLFGALSLSELGAMVPSSGGYYKIAKRAFGDYAGFVVGWTDWVGQCGSIAAVSLLIGEYARSLLPHFLPRLLVTACAALCLIALVQWRGIRWGSWFQNATSTITALVFFALIGAAFLVRHPVSTAAIAPLRPPSGLPLLSAFILVLQSVIYTFDGWNGPIYFGDEIRDPGRQIPRSLVNGVLLLSTIYVLINAALVHVLGISLLATQDLAVSKLGEIVLGHGGEESIR